MVIYDFDQVIDRNKTNSIKWEHYKDFIKGAPEDALPLWVADMDFPCAEPILNALHSRVDRQIFGYSAYRTDDYMEAVTGWFIRRFDWKIDKSSIFYSPGVVTAIAVLIRILSEPGDGILIQRPVYYPFTNKIEGNDRVVVNNPLLYKDGYYSIDFDDLDRKMALKSTKGMILCSPHNPVGRVWSADELRKIAEICSSYEKWIISDEIHCDLVRAEVTHYPLEKIAPAYKDKIITCVAPSKTFNLAGLAISTIIINDAGFKEAWIRETNDRLSIGMANPLSIKALVSAYNEGEDWLNQANDYLDQNIDFAVAYIENNIPGARVIYPEGTYLLWVDLTAYFQDHKELEQLMLNKAKLILDEGYFFGVEGIGFERINVACPRSTLSDCLKRMKEALLTEL